jgi:hypothetical protein
MKELPKNTFFDINTFPKEWGLILFPISMSRITNSQNAQSCIDHLLDLNKKIIEPKVGVTFIYGDYLYFHSQEPASSLKTKFQELIIDHKNAILNLLLGKYRHDFQITPAFTFATWNQLYLWTDNFKSYFDRLQKFAETDEKLKQYLKEDAEHLNRELTEDQKNFFLEESLVAFLAVKGKMKIYNEYVHGREEWILWCYPGNPPKTQIYLFQKNFFNMFNKGNTYENIVQYDLESKKLIDFTRIDLETYNYNYE